MRLRDDERRSWLRNRILQRALVTSGSQRIVSPSGADQKWLLDLRRITVEGQALELIAELFWDAFGERTTPFQVGGMETAAVPLVSAIALAGHRRGRPVNAFIVRKERKTSGLGRLVEGEVTSDPVVLVDDLVNSGSSLQKVRAVLAEYGIEAQARDVFCIVDFESRAGLAWRQKHGIEVTSLFTASELQLDLNEAPPRQPRREDEFTVAWRFSSPNPNVFLVAPRSTPVTDGARVFVGSDRGTLWALDLRTGEVQWSFDARGAGEKGIWSRPAVHDGRVYFGAYNGNVYCLDAKSGKQVWRFEGADWVGSSPVISPRHGLVFIGLEHATPGAQGGIAALNLKKGALEWQLRVTSYVHCTPTVGPDESWVACGTNDGDLWCLDAATGRQRWRYHAGGEIKSAPAYDPKRNWLFAGGFDGAVHVVDAASGQFVFKAQTDGFVYTTPLVLGDRAYFGSSDKTFYEIDLEARRVSRRVGLGGKIFAPPRLVRGRLFVGTTGGRLAVIDPETFSVVNSHQFPDRIVNEVVDVDAVGLMLVPTFDNRVFALRRVEHPSAEAPKPTAAESRPAATSNREASSRAASAEGSELWSAYEEGAYFRLPETDGKKLFGVLPSRRLFGAAAMVLMASRAHRHLTMADLEYALMAPVLTNQLRVFLRGYEPVGFVTWASVSPAVLAKLNRGDRLQPADWVSGPLACVMNVVAPLGGGETMLEIVRERVLSGRELFTPRPRRDGKLEWVPAPPKSTR